MTRRTELLAEAYECGVYAARVFSEPRGAPFAGYTTPTRRTTGRRSLPSILGPEAADAFFDGFAVILALPESPHERDPHTRTACPGLPRPGRGRSRHWPLASALDVYTEEKYGQFAIMRQ